jgi:hypothetical protein
MIRLFAFFIWKVILSILNHENSCSSLGQNIQENEHVRLGAYHTLDIEINRQFTLTKEVWDSMDLERLQQCTDPAHSAGRDLLNFKHFQLNFRRCCCNHAWRLGQYLSAHFHNDDCQVKNRATNSKEKKRIFITTRQESGPLLYTGRPSIHETYHDGELEVRLDCQSGVPKRAIFGLFVGRGGVSLCGFY